MSEKDWVAAGVLATLVCIGIPMFVGFGSYYQGHLTACKVWAKHLNQQDALAVQAYETECAPKD